MAEDSQKTDGTEPSGDAGGGPEQAQGDRLEALVATSTRQSTETNTIRQPPRMLVCFRIDGILFPFDLSFVRDTPQTIRSLLEIQKGLKSFPDGKLAIFGHTDYVGSEAYNKALSERRAEAVYALLTLRDDVWQRLYTRESWGQDEIVKAALEGGTSSIRPYMQGLLRRAGLAPVPARNLCPIWTGAGGEHPHMGCGEFNPHRIFTAAQLQAHRASRQRRDKENAPNRRVVVFLFDKGRLPKFPCVHSSQSSPEAAVARCDIPKDWRENRRYERHVKPTFACHFYDSQVAHHCREELDVPKLVSYPAAVVLIKGYELGLRRTRYYYSEIQHETELEWSDGKPKQLRVKYAGLEWIFKFYCNDYRGIGLNEYFTRAPRLLKMYQDTLRAEREKRKRAGKPVSTEGDDMDIRRCKQEIVANTYMKERKASGLAATEYLRRKSGSVLQDMWIVERLSDGGHPITSTAEADPAPTDPVPFREIPLATARLIHRRNGEGKVRPLLEYRTEDLVERVSGEPAIIKTHPKKGWGHWATDAGKTELRRLLSGRSVLMTAPNGDGHRPRRHHGLATVGFTEGKGELGQAEQSRLLEWIKACIKESSGGNELPYPDPKFGDSIWATDHEGEPVVDQDCKAVRRGFHSYTEEVWKARRNMYNNAKWKIYVFAAPSIKEWEEGKAEELCRKRVEHIGELVGADPALRKIADSGWGMGESWVPKSTDYAQVWTLVGAAQGSSAQKR